MRDELQLPNVAAHLVGGVLALCAAPPGVALAFPLVDPSNQSSLATGAPFAPITPTSELAPEDARGLTAQGQLLGRASRPTGPGWTFTPRITVQEEITDNAFEVKSPRRFDAITVVSPGIAINADTTRVQLHLDYQPNLYLHAINGPLNVVTQQLSMTGLITVVPDLAYVDVRALSGTQSRLGGLTGAGSVGTSGSDPITAQSLGGSSVIGGQETNRQNVVQTSSFGISPYLLRQFKDYGTAKVGASLNASRFSSINGFVANPLPTGGTNAQSLVTTEELAQFTTGEFLGRFQDVSSISLSQSNSRFEGLGGNSVNGFTVQNGPSTTSYSHREILNNQFSYAINRTFTALASVGYENIQYSQLGYPGVHGITWSVGGTFTPDPDSSFTLTYGRQNGGEAFNARGRYALTQRTLISLDYSNTIGTQLENLQRQLNGTVIAPNGQSINANTGGPQFVASNGIGVQNGLFRFRTFNASVQTTLPRDTLTAVFTWSDQASLGNLGNSTEFKTLSVSWMHELSPDLLLSSGAAYSLIGRSGGLGTDTSFAAAVGLRYLLTPTVTLSARYSFFDRVSRIPGYTSYENVLLLGVTKQF